MSFTALEAMRQKNKERFGRDLGPFRPPFYPGEETGTDLKSAALRFLEKRCEGLRFSPEKERLENETGRYLGAGLHPCQIPYNMQMDIDRLCLKNELASMMEIVTDDQYSQRMMDQLCLKYVVIVVATVPIFIIYPLLQKFFNKGILVGALKG